MTGLVAPAYVHEISAMENPSIAFVFPGQGSQRIGMLAEVAALYPTLEATFGEASDVLGYDLWAMVQSGAQEEINQTERTQPILLTASVALWRIWHSRHGPVPAMLAGHSLGEWSALVCAGVVEFPAAVGLVQLRGRFMQQAVPAGQGAMAAIMGLDDAEIRACCERAAAGGVVAPVNFNSPGQVVIAGDIAAVQRAIVDCKAAGAKRALPLPVSAPFHTTLMRPAADRLAEHVERTPFAVPRIPIVHNVHARTETDPAKIKKLIIEQIYRPVRWVDCVTALAAAGVTVVVECGPGKVLGGLSKRIDVSLDTLSLDDPAGIDQALSRF